MVTVLAASASLLGLGAAGEARASTGPTVSGPVTGGKGAVVLQATAFDLAGVGYAQSEFFVSGNAVSYVPAAALGSDGRWTVAPAGTAAYTTRIVVNRPVDPARFNGAVVVEWLNVSGGLDVAPDWVSAHNELIREGFAWVGVSAQALGVAADKSADPVRYAALSHPGDSYSYDIYTQAGRVVRTDAATVLGGLRPRAVLAEGESQSAFRLTTYVNAIQPVERAYDGFLVHSRAGNGAPLSQAPQADVPTPQVVQLRSDLRAPVLVVQTETDLIALGYLAARQADSPRFRLWEVAGTAHADHYLATLGITDNGDGTAGARAFDSMLDPPAGTPAFTCDRPINTGQVHYVMDTAQTALRRWVTVGVAPPTAPRLQVTAAGFGLDANGNVLGGVRTPAVDVPVATLSGLGQSGSTFCFLFGTTTPLSPARRAELYPTRARFVAKWTLSVAALTASGFIRPADAVELIAAVRR